MAIMKKIFAYYCGHSPIINDEPHGPDPTYLTGIEKAQYHAKYCQLLSSVSQQNTSDPSFWELNQYLKENGE